MNRFHSRGFLAAGILAAALAGPASLSASPIDPGFDLLTTDAGTQVDFSVIPGLPASISALGVVSLQGVPLSSMGGIFAGLGDTDTIVQRLGPSLPAGGTGTIDIELVALSLTSVAPVTIGGDLFFLDILSGALLGLPSNPLGQLTITTHTDLPGPGGGLFDSQLPLNALMRFTQVGNPSRVVLVQFTDTLLSADSPWCHQPVAGYPVDPNFPAGGFFPGVDCANGVPIATPILEVGGLNPVHRARPAFVAEPGTVLLFGAALAGLGFAARRARG